MERQVFNKAKFFFVSLFFGSFLHASNIHTVRDLTSESSANGDHERAIFNKIYGVLLEIRGGLIGKVPPQPPAGNQSKKLSNQTEHSPPQGVRSELDANRMDSRILKSAKKPLGSTSRKRKYGALLVAVGVIAGGLIILKLMNSSYSVEKPVMLPLINSPKVRKLAWTSMTTVASTLGFFCLRYMNNFNMVRTIYSSNERERELQNDVSEHIGSINGCNSVFRQKFELLKQQKNEDLQRTANLLLQQNELLALNKDVHAAQLQKIKAVTNHIKGSFMRKTEVEKFEADVVAVVSIGLGDNGTNSST